MIQYDDKISDRLGLFINEQAPDEDPNSDKSIISDKYSLRPRSFRRKHYSNNTDEEDENYNKRTNTTKKIKQKPAPMSKYRRKNANARERTRMREINRAFETLRKVVPQTELQQHQQSEKLTKITTLRLAMRYISDLSQVLSNQNSDCTLLDRSYFDSFLLESDGESLALQSDVSDNSFTSSDFGVDLCSESFNALDFSVLSCDISEQLIRFDTFLDNNVS